jgi:hypothetical protein
MKNHSDHASPWRRLARSLVASIYSSENLYITGCVPRALERGQLTIDCLVCETIEQLDEFERELPAEMPVERLKARIADGCIVFLAYRMGETGCKQFVGFSVRQRGIFSALGRKIPLSSDVLFGHYLEVFPQYRGQRLAQELRQFGEIYCRSQGLTKLYMVISAKNRASIQSHKHAESRMLGTVRKISLLHGLFVWETPSEDIKRALELLDDPAPVRVVLRPERPRLEETRYGKAL